MTLIKTNKTLKELNSRSDKLIARLNRTLERVKNIKILSEKELYEYFGKRGNTRYE